jgi:hypothetical protein
MCPIVRPRPGIGRLTEFRELTVNVAEMTRARSGPPTHHADMRFFDSWWEDLPTVARWAPVFVAVLALLFQHQVDYYWE